MLARAFLRVRTGVTQAIGRRRRDVQQIGAKLALDQPPQPRPLRCMQVCRLVADGRDTASTTRQWRR
ncbi:hypothetical protein BCAR13_530012 [Paraburkholderia caribensis]|nr:hypothetical protein BCAR13_530012 [Paraburkholderia caribensis]